MWEGGIIILYIALCDDDKLALEREAKMLHKIFKEKSLKYELSVFNSPIELLTKDIVYNMVFLDIEMSEMDGITLARQISSRKKDCYIFFLTAYSVYLDKAFDVNALRYLTKPVESERLSNGIDSALERMAESNKVIQVTHLEKRFKVELKIANILYISNSGRHTSITTKKGEIEADEIFSVVKKKIESEVNYFAMSHQSFYVNLKYVTEHDKNNVIISYGGNTYRADMSRRQYNEFDKKMFYMANDL